MPWTILSEAPYEENVQRLKVIIDMKITAEMKAIIFGTLLGDAWLKKTYSEGHNNSWQTAQKAESLSYMQWLYSKLKPICTRPPYLREVGSGFDNNTYKMYYLNSKALPYFTHLRKRVFYKSGKKKVNQWILGKLKPISLACWYMDDGSFVRPSSGLESHRLILNTQCFAEKGNKIIQEYFKGKWDIKFNMSQVRGQPILYANVRSILKFLKIVKPFLSQVPCMEYKMRFEYENINKSPYKAEYFRVFPENKDIV